MNDRTNWTLADYDKAINALFKRQDELKAQNMTDSQEYLQNLYTLRDMTRERLTVLA